MGKRHSDASTTSSGSGSSGSGAAGAGGSGAGAGAHRPDQYDVLYNAAVQSFVRRDHVKTQATLAKLLDLTSKLPRDPAPWYDLSRARAPGGADYGGLTAADWMTKTLKLAISANASMYSDPPKNVASGHLAHLLPPAPPTAMLQHVRDVCVKTYGADLLPPPLMLTFLLAALKLRPAEPALGFAHTFAEEWLTALPDQFVLSIASEARGPNRARVEVAREGYLKVVELFVGEVLGREGEWEMARGLLDGEMVMGSKKKEALYRHLRALEMTSRTTSPASSSILPSPGSDSVPPSPTPRRGHHSQVDSTSSSSSEATARPVGAMSGLTGRAVKGKRKGKGRADAPEPSEDASTVQPAQSEATAIPDKIYVRQPPTPRSEPTPATAPTALAFLPAAITRPLEALWRSGWFARILLPMPLVVVLLVLARRRQRLNRTETVTVRERLRRARVQGLWPWIQWWLQWWADKVAGVWKLGTTITYM